MIYKVVCAGCHETGAGQAPVLSRSEDWAAVLEQPQDLTYRHVIDGYGLMPARGLCTICSDDHLRRAVDHMLRQLRGAEPAAPAATEP